MPTQKPAKAKPAEVRQPSWTILPLYRDVAIALGLIVLTATAYCHVGELEFIHLGDSGCVYQNAHVRQGLNGENVAWAFTTAEGNWQPLTWLSHMLDVELFGLYAGAHHWMSVIFHAANVVLLFWVLRRMTDRVWRSTLVAALFAVHPLGVESVAWVAQRDVVLSGSFGLLAVAAYARYVRQPGLARYVPVFLLLGLGLMASPTVATLPLVLLLLDHWPLRRMPDWPTVVRRAVEKIPLAVLSLTSAIITYVAHQRVAAAAMEVVPLAARLENALVACRAYLGKTFRPIDLAVLYTLPEDLSAGTALRALALLATITVVVLWLGRALGYLPVGWLWFLAMLLPVIVVAQASDHFMPDHYAYLPIVGLLIAVGWFAASVAVRGRVRPYALSLAAIVILAGLAWLTDRQVQVWSSSETLLRHSLEVAQGNETAHNLLGVYLVSENRTDEAIAEFEAALEITPESALAHEILARTLYKKGRVEKASEHCDKALQLNKECAIKFVLLSQSLQQEGRLAEAAGVLRCLGRLDFPGVRSNLAVVLVQLGKRQEALDVLREIRLSQPQDTVALNTVAWILATSPDATLRNAVDAISLAEEAARLSNRRNPEVLDTLAAAYAEGGRFREAFETAERAEALARQNGEGLQARRIRARAELYRVGRPFREPPPRGRQGP